MPLLFIIIPLIELYFIIVVGEAIGAFWTVILVILTAFIGVSLLRIQGMKTLAKAQRSMAQGQVPAMEMMEGLALAVAGVLLITPGFITDAMGLLCLIPASRQAIIRYIMSKSTVRTRFGGATGNPTGGFQQGNTYQHNPQSGSAQADSTQEKAPKVGRTIEGEYRRED